jgi:4-amino-4-deoxy-L-arabinose transferase-like glycosyltransferase
LNFKEHNPRQWWVITSGGILLLALTLRLWGLGNESAWIDEAYSINLAKHSVLEILQGTAADQHPPLYYLLLHYWLLFGSSVGYARVLSLVIGIIHIGQILQFGRKLAGDWLALGTGLLLAISPMHVWYSQEVRMYILLALLTTASTSELWNCLHGKNHWLLYAIYSTLAIYTHYFAIFVFGAYALLVLAWAWMKREKKGGIHWAGAMFAVGSAFLPWFPIALNQSRFHTMSWIAPPGMIDFRDTLLRLLFGSGILAVPGWMRWVGLVLLGVLTIWAVIRLQKKNLPYRQSFGFVATWAFAPFFIVAVISLINPIFQFKQFLIILAPFLFWVVWVCWLTPRRLGYLLFAVILASSGVYLVYQQITLTKDDWRGASAYLQSHMVPGDILYSNPAASNLALSLYGNSLMPSDGYPPHYDIVQGGWDGKIITSELTDNILKATTVGYYRLWLIENSPEFWDPQKTIPGWLNTHAHLIDDQYFGKIHLSLYQLGEK